MKKIASTRQPGGVSRSIDYLRSSIICPTNQAAKTGAIVDLAELMTAAIDQIELGDRECGYFVAELFAHLCKNRAKLSDKNQTFRHCYSMWESARKGSPLRRLIHAILSEAHRDRRIQQITKAIPKGTLVFKVDKTLLALPEFSNDPNVVSEWTDKLVYPNLRAMQSEVAMITGNLKKARDENGKFQISRLKPLIKQTVGRIAALPKAYYFDIS